MTGHTATSSTISEKPVRKLTKPRHVAQRRHHEKWHTRPDACKNDRIALQANLAKTVTPFEMVATHERNCSDNLAHGKPPYIRDLASKYTKN